MEGGVGSACVGGYTDYTESRKEIYSNGAQIF